MDAKTLRRAQTELKDSLLHYRTTYLQFRELVSALDQPNLTVFL